jgi:hypothetical protein
VKEMEAWFNFLAVIIDPFSRLLGKVLLMLFCWLFI